MDWHNFKVMSMYAVLVSIFLFIVGKGEFSIIALVGYSIYGLIDCIIHNSKKKKLDKELDEVSDYIKEITICHIEKRHPKLRKRVERRIKKDITNGNYQIKSFRLTDTTSVSDDEPDGGNEYFLTFNNGDTYRVYSIVYDRVHVGDIFYILTTPTDTLKVIRSKTDYLNMFTY